MLMYHTNGNFYSLGNHVDFQRNDAFTLVIQPAFELFIVINENKWHLQRLENLVI
jgi:hypothetical protein